MTNLCFVIFMRSTWFNVMVTVPEPALFFRYFQCTILKKSESLLFVFTNGSLNRPSIKAITSFCIVFGTVTRLPLNRTNGALNTLTLNKHTSKLILTSKPTEVFVFFQRRISSVRCPTRTMCSSFSAKLRLNI